MHGVQCTENIYQKRLARAVDTTHAHSSACSGRNGLAKSRFLNITTQEQFLLAVVLFKVETRKEPLLRVRIFHKSVSGWYSPIHVRPYPACTDLRCRVWSRLL